MIDELLSLAGEACAHARKLGADAVHAVAADGRSTEISILDGKISRSMPGNPPPRSQGAC